MIAAQTEFDKGLGIANTLHGFKASVVEQQGLKLASLVHAFKIEINGIGILLEFQMNQLLQGKDFGTKGSHQLIASQDDGRDGSTFLTVNTVPFTNVLFHHLTPPHWLYNNSQTSRSVKSSLRSWHKACPKKADTPPSVLRWDIFGIYHQ